MSFRDAIIKVAKQFSRDAAGWILTAATFWSPEAGRAIEAGASH